MVLGYCSRLGRLTLVFGCIYGHLCLAMVEAPAWHNCRLAIAMAIAGKVSHYEFDPRHPTDSATVEKTDHVLIHRRRVDEVRRTRLDDSQRQYFPTTLLVELARRQGVQTVIAEHPEFIAAIEQAFARVSETIVPGAVNAFDAKDWSVSEAVWRMIESRTNTLANGNASPTLYENQVERHEGVWKIRNERACCGGGNEFLDVAPLVQERENEIFAIVHFFQDLRIALTPEITAKSARLNEIRKFCDDILDPESPAGLYARVAAELAAQPDVQRKVDILLAAYKHEQENNQNFVTYIRALRPADAPQSLGLYGLSALVHAIMSDVWTLHVMHLDQIELQARFAENGGAELCQPKFSSDIDHPFLRIEGGQLMRALLDKERAVPNNIVLGGEGHPQAIIVTGANKQGKSAFLRMIANIVMHAQAGMRTFARIVELTPLKVFYHVAGTETNTTSLGQAQIAALARDLFVKPLPKNTLILMDEIGSGIAEAARPKVQRALVEYLIKQGHLVVIATHDISFAKYYEGDPRFQHIFFDKYEAKPGIQESKVAFFEEVRDLMRASGWPPEIIEQIYPDEP